MVSEQGPNPTTPAPPEVPEQAGKILASVAGYVGFKTIEMGLSNGLIEALSEHPGGLSADELAEKAGMESFYTGVWSKAAYGAGILELNDDAEYVLAPHMDNLLLNAEFPGFVGGIMKVFTQPEIFDNMLPGNNAMTIPMNWDFRRFR